LNQSDRASDASSRDLVDIGGRKLELVQQTDDIFGLSRLQQLYGHAADGFREPRRCWSRAAFERSLAIQSQCFLRLQHLMEGGEGQYGSWHRLGVSVLKRSKRSILLPIEKG
jgi:hypothetical protein